MTMRELYNRHMAGEYADDAVNGRANWMGFQLAMRLMWPPKPTQQHLDAANVRVVGDEPVLIMPGDAMPLYFWNVDDVDYGMAFEDTPLRSTLQAAFFVWRVERKEAGK